MAILTSIRPHTYAFLSHLLARGVDVAHVVFEGSLRRGLRVRFLHWLEEIYLRVEHALFLHGHPCTEHDLFRRYGALEDLLRRRGVQWSVVEDHNGSRCTEILRRISPDVMVLYGTRIILPHVLQIPAVGTLNLHSSLLPRFRGGKSEFWVLLTGEHDACGATVHWVEPRLDAGPIFLQERIPVDPDDTPSTLRRKVQLLSAVLICEALRRVEQGENVRVPQDEERATTYRNPKLEDLAEYRRKFPGKPIFSGRGR